LTGVVAQGGA